MKRPLIVELAGPAGAGKSTLTAALSECDRNIRVGMFPNIRDLKSIPFFLLNTISLLPVFAAIYRNNKQRPLTTQQMVIMAILHGWFRQLRAANPTNGEVIILDQGPIYMLSELIRFGPANFRNTTSKWWRYVCDVWADTLDIVICLDAPDTLLMKRIRERGKGHGVKEHSDQWAIEFLARYRDAQNEVINSMIADRRDLRMIQVDTSHVSQHEVVEKILALLICKEA